MKKICLKILFTIIFCLFSCTDAKAVQFDLLVLPTDIFHVCENYFCFPEASEIAADYIIQDLNSYKRINAIELPQVRNQLSENTRLKNITENLLNQYKNSEKIDFQALSELAKEFNVKSVILVSSYTTTDKSQLKRQLWETLEVGTAFRISYPINLITSTVLTDNVNNVVMWSSKFSKNITNSEGYFYAGNQNQAISQLEKIKLYFKDFVAPNVSQNVYLRFFPKDVRTFAIKKNQSDDDTPKFVPNALEHLIKPQMIKELDEGSENTIESNDDFIFAF
ncbi:hypothetical protein IJ541_03270 [bacterium]|nr:hypothetical protein [bacterium]